MIKRENFHIYEETYEHFSDCFVSRFKNSNNEYVIRYYSNSGKILRQIISKSQPKGGWKFDFINQDPDKQKFPFMVKNISNEISFEWLTSLYDMQNIILFDF